MLSENASKMHFGKIMKELSPGNPAVREKRSSPEEINEISGGVSDIWDDKIKPKSNIESKSKVEW